MSPQLELVYAAPSVPCPTSEAAAAALSPEKLHTQRVQVALHIYAAATDDQRTADAIEAAMGEPHQSISRCVRDLVIAGWIVTTGRVARSRYGRAVRVYEVTDVGERGIRRHVQSGEIEQASRAATKLSAAKRREYDAARAVLLSVDASIEQRESAIAVVGRLWRFVAPMDAP